MSNNKRYFLEDNNAFKEIHTQKTMREEKSVCFYSQIHGYTYNNMDDITTLFCRVRIQLKGGYKR